MNDPIISTNNQPIYLATSRKIANLPGFATLLGKQVQLANPFKSPAECAGVLAWGRKPSAVKSEQYAQKHNLPLIRLEDGFLRSVGLGNQDPALSLVVDDLGIYYDAGKPSRLEQLVGANLSADEIQRSQELIQLWRENRVSKYNCQRDYTAALPLPYVLVADQTFNDASVQYGQADSTSFQRMLQAALDAYPDCTVLVKIHPDVVVGKKQGYFQVDELRNNPRIVLFSDDAHPVSLIEQAKAVYCVTSQIGFEALLWGKKVRVFGMPFYAGWGLTQDKQPAPTRRHHTKLENLVHAALIAYPRYLQPETSELCQVEDLIPWLGLQRRMRERFPKAIYAYGFSFWKKPIVRRYFAGSTVNFDQQPPGINENWGQVIWSNKIDARLEPEKPIIRLEDGYIRSVGLGVDLTQPLSWVMDTSGIYFDATKPSDLEIILQNTPFDDLLLQRAEKLKDQLIQANITKYNDSKAEWYRPVHLKNTCVILVPGQVEADDSIQYGSPTIRSNIALLHAVRNNNPDAYVIYKPHPDVLAGLRDKGEKEHTATNWCNEVVSHVAMGKLLSEIDEVHTMTSLTGFEALLRGKKTYCYGQPFYAGWGLTTDFEPIDRRTRLLTLNELIAGTLILYPTYLSRMTGKFTTPEQTLTEIIQWRENYQEQPNLKQQLLRLYLKLEKQIQKLT